jgi:hypothetical protein
MITRLELPRIVTINWGRVDSSNSLASASTSQKKSQVSAQECAPLSGPSQRCATVSRRNCPECHVRGVSRSGGVDSQGMRWALIVRLIALGVPLSASGFRPQVDGRATGPVARLSNVLAQWAVLPRPVRQFIRTRMKVAQARTSGRRSAAPQAKIHPSHWRRPLGWNISHDGASGTDPHASRRRRGGGGHISASAYT